MRYVAKAKSFDSATTPSPSSASLGAGGDDDDDPPGMLRAPSHQSMRYVAKTKSFDSATTPSPSSSSLQTMRRESANLTDDDLVRELLRIKSSSSDEDYVDDEAEKEAPSLKGFPAGPPHRKIRQ